MNNAKAIAEATQKIIQNQFSASVRDVLNNLGVNTDSKEIKNLIQKKSRKLAEKLIKSLRKEIKMDSKIKQKKRANHLN